MHLVQLSDRGIVWRNFLQPRPLITEINLEINFKIFRTAKKYSTNRDWRDLIRMRGRARKRERAQTTLT